MRVTPELVDRFLKQECTSEENDFISKYFDQHPKEIEQYLSEDEWNVFETDAVLHPAISKKMQAQIAAGIGENATKKKSPVKIWLVAACLLAAIGIGLIIGTSKFKSKNESTATTALQVSNHGGLQINDTVFNTTNKLCTLVLADGSTVLLSPQSSIYYHKPFTQKLRNVYLQGEATFKVAKDRKRPFTVYSGGVTTTALGTCFKITSKIKSKQITVRLYEGKVVIKKQTDKQANGVFLTPGHEFLLNQETGVSQLLAFNNVVSTNAVDNVVNSSVKSIRFHNEPLSNVIIQLQSIYHIRIKADEGDLKDKYFTGIVDKATEQVNGVLNTIATLNKFELKKEEGVFILTSKNTEPNDTLKSKRP